VVAVVAKDGSIAARYSYDPYGVATSLSEIGWLFIVFGIYTVVRAALLVNRWRSSSSRR
jgi:hypothetical protein